MRTRRCSNGYILGCLALLGGAPTIAAQTPQPLTLGDPIRVTIAPGDTLRFVITAPSGSLVRGHVEQQSANVAVRILDPAGSTIRNVDLRDRGAEPFQFEATAGGVYPVHVISHEDSAGSIALSLSRLEPLSDNPATLAEQLLSGFGGPDSPAASVRVWRDGETVFTGTYGMASLAYGVPFSASTPTNIGSTSKQFTSFAVMLLVEEGLVSLEDDVRLHLPEVPDFGETVRVRHLLSHASGYREIYNLTILEGRRFDLGDYIDRSEILRVLDNQPVLQNRPGAEWNYNNTAYGLAALLVERLSGMSFTAFMEERVFAPLGMRNSVARPHAAAIIPGRSQGYVPDRAGGWQEARDLGAAIGAGAVYASLEDLQIWAENYRTARVGTPETMREMMTPFITTVGDTTTYGLGLMIDEQRGLKRVHHGGADVAHRSMLAFYPDINAGITVQGNSSLFDSSVAFRLAEAFFGDAMGPASDEAPARPEAPETEPWTPSATELAAFTGRYLSEEVEAFYEIILRDGALVLTHRRRDDATMTPDTVDAFRAGTIRISFERDRHGQILALYMDNQRTRDVRFAKIR
jgi:CubicO group peptidase (beta-lactamase class C family)